MQAGRAGQASMWGGMKRRVASPQSRNEHCKGARKMAHAAPWVCLVAHACRSCVREGTCRAS